MKLTVEQYFGKYLHHKDVTPARRENAEKLVITCNRLLDTMGMAGVLFKTNPLTGSIVGGETLGGFRPQDCPIGAPLSAHKQGMAVDIYDPNEVVDNWLYSHQMLLKDYNLYFEHPTATKGWSHWSIRKPNSGRTFFYP